MSKTGFAAVEGADKTVKDSTGKVVSSNGKHEDDPRVLSVFQAARNQEQRFAAFLSEANRRIADQLPAPYRRTFGEYAADNPIVVVGGVLILGGLVIGVFRR